MDTVIVWPLIKVIMYTLHPGLAFSTKNNDTNKRDKIDVYKDKKVKHTIYVSYRNSFRGLSRLTDGTPLFLFGSPLSF
jgi:hypothetical protein